MNGIEDQPIPSVAPDDADVRSVSSDNDNENVREKLKKTTIAPPSSSSLSRPGSGANNNEPEDHEMSTSTTPEDGQRRTRKRSHDESDDDKGGEGGGRRRLKPHERKRSREITEGDRLRAGSGLERVKTPPTHPEEGEGGIAQRVSSPMGVLERKRSLSKLDKEEDAAKKNKISKTEEDRRKREALETTAEKKAAAEKDDSSSSSSSSSAMVTKLPESSGFANTSTKSPFAAGGGSGVNIFGNTSSANLFAQSKFGALSGSSASPFGTLGSKSPQSPFGALKSSSPFGAGSAFGAPAGSVFGGGGSGGFSFSSALKSQPAKKPFGAPDNDDKSDDDDDNSSDEGEDRPERAFRDEDIGSSKPLGLKEQEIMTGEEDETTIFKCGAKIFAFDTAMKAWKERGRGQLKINRTTPSVDEFGLTSDDEGEQKKKRPAKQSARLIMRTDGTLVVVLNSPIYQHMKIGDEPNGNQLQMVVMENGGLAQIILRVRNNAIAREMHKHITDLQKEIWG